MAEAHVSLGEVPPGNCQQFIDKGANEKFVYLSNWKTVVSSRLWEISPVGRSLTLPLPLPLGRSRGR